MSCKQAFYATVKCPLRKKGVPSFWIWLRLPPPFTSWQGRNVYQSYFYNSIIPLSYFCVATWRALLNECWCLLTGQWQELFMFSQKWNCAASLFPIQNYNVLSHNFHLLVLVSVSDLYIPRIGRLFCCSQIGKQILGIYKSLRDTWI